MFLLRHISFEKRSVGRKILLPLQTIVFLEEYFFLKTINLAKDNMNHLSKLNQAFIVNFFNSL